MSIHAEHSHSLPESGFAADVLKLVSGTTLVQVISLLVTPLLTRIFLPEAFGLLALFLSISSILGIVACLRYEVAIPLPRQNEDAVALLFTAMVFTGVVAGMTAGLLAIFGESMVTWIHAPALSSYLWMIPVAVGLTGLTAAYTYWNTRMRHFGVISFATLSGAIITATAKVAAGWAGYRHGKSLILATVAGQLLTVILLVSLSLRNSGAFFRTMGKIDLIRTQIIRYRKFPLIDTWGTLFNNVSWQIPPLLFAVFFSQTVVGYYALAFRFIQLPMLLMGMAIGQVFYPRIATVHAHERSLSPLVLSMFRRLIALGVFPSLLFAMYGAELFTFIFGSRWAEAGLYAQILSLWAFVWFIASPLSMILNAIERQGHLLCFHLLIFATRLLSIVIGSLYQDVYLALMLFSVTGVLVYGALCLTVLRISSVTFLSAFRSALPYLSVSVPLLLMMTVVQGLASGPVAVSATAIISCGIYFVFVFWIDDGLRLWAQQFLHFNKETRT